MEIGSEDTGSAGGDIGPTLRWPPPGLERLQGDLGRVAARAALAGGLLVLPFLFVTARESPFITLGPFADAWWITALLATTGLAFALDALIRCGRVLRRAAEAIGRGYTWPTIGYVLADVRRDMGFLLVGARHFSALDSKERWAIALLRVVATLLLTAAGLWLSLALSFGLLLAARGLISPNALWMMTLLPAAALYAWGGVARMAEDSRVRRARRGWYDRPWSADLVTHEIEAWRADLPEEVVTGGSRYSRFARWAGVAFGALAVFVAIPVVTLVPTSVVGPMLSLLSAPGFETVQQRAASAEAFRSYRVDPDSGVSPGEASRLLQNLLYVGSDRVPPPGEREPPRRIEEPWLPGDSGDGSIASDLSRWAGELFPVVVAGADEELSSFLERVAGHPGHAEFSRLARAMRVDVAVARWEDPFPASVSIQNLPVPRFSEMRSGAYAHIAAAAHTLRIGQSGRAEQMVREVISVGFLLVDQGPTLIENLVGFLLIEQGGAALASLYEATGRDDEAAELERVRSAATRAADRVPRRVPAGTEAYVRSLPLRVTDSTTVRGMRWEYFIGVATLAPCLNMHRIVFGPDQAYRDFVVEAHAALVEWPSEEGLFDLARAGYLDAAAGGEETWWGGLLSVAMRPGESACGQVVRTLRTVRPAP